MKGVGAADPAVAAPGVKAGARKRRKKMKIREESDDIC